MKKMDYNIFHEQLNKIKLFNKQYKLTNAKSPYFLIAHYRLYPDKTINIIKRTIKSKREQEILFTALKLCSDYLYTI